MKEFLKTTIVGGLLFLLPLGLVLFVLSYALRLATNVAQPISKALHPDQLGDVAGIGITTFVGVLLLVLVSFAAGIVARTSIGGRISGWFESSVLSALPQYQMLKSMAEGLAQLEGDTGIRPALISIEDGWQIGYILEVLENDWLAVFLPQAPTPMSGNVMYLETHRVRPLGITMVQAMGLLQHCGHTMAQRHGRPSDDQPRAEEGYQRIWPARTCRYRSRSRCPSSRSFLTN